MKKIVNSAGRAVRSRMFSPDIERVIVMRGPRGTRGAAGKAQKIFRLKTYCNISKSKNLP
jgi:hypothetical protein